MVTNKEKYGEKTEKKGTIYPMESVEFEYYTRILFAKNADQM